ncbi:AraC family transcriptional regulator [Ameyamaea chiangmaiensis NBRC 103196]|uniref:GlxA family transcriptional regulator n=1 Tax=Ameyamaea chiangmaiensis TaxID=442969 RepID=A0A850PA66_9PROT|nr:GlxA family transcriptional regulator [Ameyamaea chiangmaiensis]MBS4076068.1 GlxA family transcriptional regulator [Ameyamaea chiangmaiensis]NVN39843.1 GlxA family transcriptional regulator [Ameyamaea chiangmaiensis]GBQ66893.1 AraC family transcriptional regulator [Ameyamaea chiangmaiensis NBRC 103196]
MAPRASDLASLRRFGFLTLKNYSLIAVSNAIEALRMANRVTGCQDYAWRVLSLDGAPVAASNGLALHPTEALGEAEGLDVLFVCGGIDVRAATSEKLRMTLRRVARQRIVIGALCTGTFALADAGLLRGYRCAIHWENLGAIREEFPEIDLVDELFVIDRDRMTCTGGAVPLDLMLRVIAAHVGAARAREIAMQFLLARDRAGSEAQPLIALDPLPPSLGRAVQLMDSHIDQKLSVGEVASAAGVSERQLERLFRAHTGSTPAAYLAAARLERARRLLRQTGMSVTDIGVACGFTSLSHFSTAFRNRFGYAPRLERQQRAP